MSKAKILTDSSQWSPDTYEHIFHEQDVNPPEAELKQALKLWGLRRPRVDDFQDWWKDLTEFDPSLKGWKLAGHGSQPNTVLHPGEKPHKSDIKLTDAPKPPVVPPQKPSDAESGAKLLGDIVVDPDQK